MNVRVRLRSQVDQLFPFVPVARTVGEIQSSSLVMGLAENHITSAWVDATPDAVVLTDGGGRMLAVNPAFDALFGISPPSLPSEPVEDLIIASRFRSAYRAARRAALSGRGSSVSGRPDELVALRQDGGEFAVTVRVARVSGDAAHVVTWIQDLTEDQTLVARTVRRAVLLERAEELAGFGSWEWTPDTGHLQFSDNLFRIYGLQPGDITPSVEYMVSHCHPSDQERVAQAIGELGRRGRHPELRYRYVWPDGTVRNLAANVVSVAEPDGPLRKMIGAVQDVTEQHQAERELAAHFAVSDALAAWEPGPAGALRLVKDLAEALDYEVGALWVPRGDVMVAKAVWQARALHSSEHETAIREARVKPNVGLVGSVWMFAEPAQVLGLLDHPTKVVRAFAAQTGLHASLGVPAVYGREVLAVLAFSSRRPFVLTDRFMRSLTGIGYEIGHFLARRRGELSAPALTARELEVLQLSATGHTRRQIAAGLGIAESTVKTHLKHIYEKLGVPDRATAVGEALRQGLIR